MQRLKKVDALCGQDYCLGYTEAVNHFLEKITNKLNSEKQIKKRLKQCPHCEDGYHKRWRYCLYPEGAGMSDDFDYIPCTVCGGNGEIEVEEMINDN